MTSTTPYLAVHDAKAAIAFYQAAFGATVGDLYESGGRIGHVTLHLGDARLYVSDEAPEYGAIAPRTVGSATAAVVLAVADPDATYAAAVSAGADPQRPVTDDLGGRSGWLVDPFGHRWNIRSE
jgi:PhnB protein